jgi:hypothetical protein
MLIRYLSKAGTQQVDDRQPLVDERADRGLGAHPAVGAAGDVEAVVDQQAVDDHDATAATGWFSMACPLLRAGCGEPSRDAVSGPSTHR